MKTYLRSFASEPRRGPHLAFQDYPKGWAWTSHRCETVDWALPQPASSGPAPEAAPELVLELAHGAALSIAREAVRALSVALALLPVHGVGREVEVDPVSLVLPEVQKVCWAEEVSLWLPDPPESSSLGAISNISYFSDETIDCG